MGPCETVLGNILYADKMQNLEQVIGPRCSKHQISELPKIEKPSEKVKEGWI